MVWWEYYSLFLESKSVIINYFDKNICQKWSDLSLIFDFVNRSITPIKPQKKDSKSLKSTQLLLNSFESKNLSQNPLLFDSCERFNLSFNLNIRSSKLSKDNYYNPYQYKLYRLIKFLKEERGIGYRRISHILYDKGFRSVRTNSILKYNYVYSIYYKGKIRENRINRNFESEITDVKLLWCFLLDLKKE